MLSSVNHPIRQFLGASAATEALRRDIELAARSDAKVLISGETGVGKEVVAQLIHQQSRRRTAPFIYSEADVAALVHAAGTITAPLASATVKALISLIASTIL